MCNKKTDESGHWHLFCFRIPLQYISIFFGCAQLALAINDYVLTKRNSEGKMIIIAFGLCAALQLFGAINRKHFYLWPSIILISLICLCMTILTFLMRLLWNQHEALANRTPPESHDIDATFLVEWAVFLVIMFTFVVPLNYAVYTYATQLRTEASTEKLPTQRSVQVWIVRIFENISHFICLLIYHSLIMHHAQMCKCKCEILQNFAKNVTINEKYFNCRK